MTERILTERRIQKYAAYLLQEEKSKATCEKYLRDVRRFQCFAGSGTVTKERVVAWKKSLVEQGYAVRSVNSMLASVNSLLTFLGWDACKVKGIRIQRQTYCPEEKELTKEEYLRLLKASGKDEQLNLLLQTVCGTGIRVSELQYFTVEALRNNRITVSCKSKTRTILVPGRLKKMLLDYAKRKRISAGPVFVNKFGKSLDRSTIWRRMKQLCKAAGVLASKVFPHNLRKLFARTFYAVDRDIAKLADILGHSSINTTRIYIMTSGMEHRRKIEGLGLVVPDRNVTESALCDRRIKHHLKHIKSRINYTPAYVKNQGNTN